MKNIYKISLIALLGFISSNNIFAEKFLKEGSKLKAFVFFKGRSIIYKDQGQILLLRLATDLEEFGKVEAMPVLEGKRMIMFIAPKKKK